MNRILIVYFSRTRHTRRVAEELAQRLGADIESIQETGHRTGWWGYLRSLGEALQRRASPTATSTQDPSRYDLVVLGTPVWAHTMSSPLRSYIVAHAPQLKSIAVFCTQGGSGGDSTLAQIAQLCQQRPIATLVLNAQDIDSDHIGVALDGFATAIRVTH